MVARGPHAIRACDARAAAERGGKARDEDAAPPRATAGSCAAGRPRVGLLGGAVRGPLLAAVARPPQGSGLLGVGLAVLVSPRHDVQPDRRRQLGRPAHQRFVALLLQLHWRVVPPGDGRSGRLREPRHHCAQAVARLSAPAGARHWLGDGSGGWKRRHPRVLQQRQRPHAQQRRHENLDGLCHDHFQQSRWPRPGPAAAVVRRHLVPGAYPPDLRQAHTHRH